jgi:hypothetical protein
MPVTTSTSDDLEPPAVVLTETIVAEATAPCVSEQPSCEQEPPRPDTASVEPEIIVAPSLNDLLLQDGPDEEPQALPAAVMPEAAAPEPATETRDDEVVIQIGNRHYRVRGLGQNLSHNQMRVNVLASRPAPDGVGELIHVDSFDLYLARHRATFIRQTSIELMLKEDAIKKDVGRVLLKLEALQAELIARTLAPKDKHCPVEGPDRDEALAFLKEPNLVQRILLDFDRCGLVGEETNKLVGYLAATSRKLDSPGGWCSRVRGRQVLAHGCSTGLHAGRRQGAVLGGDRPKPLLHGPRRSSPQDLALAEEEECSTRTSP